MNAATRLVAGSLRGWAGLAGFSEDSANPQDDQTFEDAVERAADREELLSEAMRIAGVGGWELDLATQTLSWSDETFRIFGLEPGSLQPSNELFYSLVQEDDRARMLSQQDLSSETGQIFDEEYRIVRPDGELRYLNSRAQVVARGRERKNRFLGIVRDITEQRILEQRLERERIVAQRAQADLIHLSRVNAMGMMASAMAHELSQPLMSIVNYAASLRKSLDQSGAPGDAVAAAGDVENAANRASDIIRRLRTMTSKGAVETEAVSLACCVDEAVQMALTGSYVDISVSVPSHLQVLSDPVQLQQVLVNLLRNAVEAVQEQDGAAIRVTAAVEASRVSLKVSDNGPGIEGADLERIFEPFVSSKPDGMGIGLAISRTIIEAFEGRLDVESTPGAGSTFIVSLPLPLEKAERA